MVNPNAKPDNKKSNDMVIYDYDGNIIHKDPKMEINKQNLNHFIDMEIQVNEKE